MWEVRRLKNDENQSAALFDCGAIQTHSSLCTSSIEVSLFDSLNSSLTILFEYFMPLPKKEKFNLYN